MYIEFIIGYILMGVIAALLIVVIVLQCIILKKASKISTRPQQTSNGPYSGASYSSTAVCRNCATQFDAALTVCPKCGTPK